MQMGSTGRGRLEDGTHELRAHSVRLSPDRHSEEASGHENSNSSLAQMVRPLGNPCDRPGDYSQCTTSGPGHGHLAKHACSRTPLTNLRSCVLPIFLHWTGGRHYMGT